MKKWSKNLILHADVDAFFVSCELTLRPELKGLPVIVGEDRGIAVAISIEAKKLGVTRGMPVFKIKKLFPEVVILSHHFDLYNDISDKMHQILSNYCQKIEVYSIDECFAIAEPAEIKYFGGAKKFLTELKNEIEKTLGVTYSFGLARTKALAKQASKLQKPNGMVLLLSREDEVQALKATSIEHIWGIGKQTIPRLQNKRLKTAYDFINLPEIEITKYFGEPLLILQRELSGESVFEVKNNVDPRGQKSIQATSTFRPNSSESKIIWREISENAERACANAREIKLLSNKVSFFIKNAEFKYFYSEIKLPLYTVDPGIILNAIEVLFFELLKDKGKIRSTGVILHNLTREENIPLDLFGKQDAINKKTIVEEVADKIREKYGKDIIKRGTSLNRK